MAAQRTHGTVYGDNKTADHGGGGEKDQSGGARQVNGVILVYDIRFQGVQASRAAKAPGAPRAPRPFPRLVCRLRTEYIGLTARRGPVAPRGP